MLNNNNSTAPANNNTNAPLWRLYFEMAEDYRYKQEIGEVPPAALSWLEDHWEVLPVDNDQVTGELVGTPDGVFLYETTEVVSKHEDWVEVLRTRTHAPERVEL